MMPGGRGGYNPYATNSNSHAIRQEIQRFESVHPSIYAIYDLIDLVPDPHLAQQIREHVVCIEDSFVNSQEWTLSRTVPDLRLGIVGSLSSGKSALVHRYLTGSYMQEESPEGGRFKKEVVVEGQSYLLLIRDEGGPPELQFTSWVDAIIFVFSLENDSSFSAIYNYYAKMSQFRNIQEIPLILVGTQDGICDNNPRIIEDARARKLAMDLKRCAYYETCATYGLNVERVFQDACQKIVQVKGLGSRPTTPTSFMPRPFTTYMSSPTNGYANAIIQQSHSPAGNNYQPHSPAHILPHQNSFTSNKDIRPTPSSQSTSNVIINPIGVDEYRTRSSLIQDRNSLSQDRLQDRTSSISDRLQDRISLPADRLGLDRMGLERERSGMNSSGSGSGSEGNTKFLIPGKSLKQNFFFRGHILSPPPIL
ncbi:centaurin-gamma-1A [Eurytemora carolleeae]|uniref:centaurin-gamma-1A n=1 Tax=Eurytemora carolleeae TaxID=1294199 RepID=UPI000C767DA1|nr:centaurin-gamma-1A [Eurytemora carolleeae]|eukprot:XP_023346543.1 centaurin-gamma-1A-like [Eurytemora affinis]